ncbi:MAG: septum formation inhibitor Maf [Maribacter sp.]|nr:septum formation inhibitor Maf [Maribacter sp.]
MKNWIRIELTIVVFAAIIGTLESCMEIKAEDSRNNVLKPNIEETDNKIPRKQLTKEFKDYWYAGDAEISSYKLNQARYGAIREGHSVLIFVTEPFVADKQVKADRNSPGDIPVLKLNSTKKYLTGIYPYSIMTSSFYPVHDNLQAIKVAFSAQEWCGQVFAQLNNREKFKIKSYSYFESESDKIYELDKNILENEIWNKIRINPNELPTGDLQIIPSFEYIRMAHRELKAYRATTSLTELNGLNTYKIEYPELNRILEIKYKPAFPHTIESWSETYKSGFGDKAKTMTSTATKIKTIKTPYWKQNGNNDISLRDTLGI